MVINRAKQSISHFKFKDLPQLLSPSDFLILNNTKVFKARLIGKRLTGAKVEILLTKQIQKNLFEAMLQPAKRLKEQEIIQINNDFKVKIIKKYLSAQLHIVELIGKYSALINIDKYGQIPLPPYIQVKNTNQFEDQYQTIYAHKIGAVAAPTAGLHFTSSVFEKLKRKNIHYDYITLHTGLGTFLPIKTNNILKHKMHKEEFEIENKVANNLNLAKQNGHKIIAVGTTVARTLESSFKQNKFIAQKNTTQLFIYPGFQFKAIDALITNFHLPKSTLLLLVMAFAGKDLIKKAYEIAILEKYRFYSFGDAMLIL